MRDTPAVGRLDQPPQSTNKNSPLKLQSGARGGLGTERAQSEDVTRLPKSNPARIADGGTGGARKLHPFDGESKGESEVSHWSWGVGEQERALTLPGRLVMQRPKVCAGGIQQGEARPLGKWCCVLQHTSCALHFAGGGCLVVQAMLMALST